MGGGAGEDCGGALLNMATEGESLNKITGSMEGAILSVFTVVLRYRNKRIIDRQVVILTNG